MFRRPAIAFIATTGTLAACAFLAPAAHAGATATAHRAAAADPADPVVCTVTGTSPSVIVVGTAPQTVRFGVQTTCDGTHPVSWSLASDIYPGSSGASWLLLRNFHRPTGEKFTYTENANGDFTVKFTGADTFKGNQMAGPHPLFAGAFFDADADGLADPEETVSYFSGSFVAKRATAVTSFSVTPGHRHAGQKITVSGALTRADWDTGQDDGFAAPVELQFRPDGGRYHDVKTVADDGTSASTTATVTRSGTWRYHYAGDDISGASDSVGVHVDVVGSHRHRHAPRG